MANGILIVDKPADWTSHDVVAKLRGIFREKRIGHGGTLDPMATGVLPVFLGRATRAVEFASEREKEYIAGLRLGTVTATQDITGTVLETNPVSVTRADVETALARFRGEIQQIPPMYSAIKKNGKRLYELARKGQEVEREARSVTIFELELLEQVSPTDYVLRVLCSKGTYVRTLCHDLGTALGCGGTLFSLRRTKSAGFTLSDSVTLEEIQETETPASLLLPVERYFIRYPVLTLSDGEQERRVRNGNTLFLPPLKGEGDRLRWRGPSEDRTPQSRSARQLPFQGSQVSDGLYRVHGPSGEFLALSQVTQGVLTTIKSFFEV